MLGQCYLCQSSDLPPVAVCCCCGVFVCREYVFRLVHRTPGRPLGLAAPKAVPTTRIEMVCYLNGLVDREPVRKRAV